MAGSIDGGLEEPGRYRRHCVLFCCSNNDTECACAERDRNRKRRVKKRGESVLRMRTMEDGGDLTICCVVGSAPFDVHRLEESGGERWRWRVGERVV